MKELMLGNEAVARGAYEAGVRVAVAYPDRVDIAGEGVDIPHQLCQACLAAEGYGRRKVAVSFFTCFEIVVTGQTHKSFIHPYHRCQSIISFYRRAVN